MPTPSTKKTSCAPGGAPASASSRGPNLGVSRAAAAPPGEEVAASRPTAAVAAALLALDGIGLVCVCGALASLLGAIRLRARPPRDEGSALGRGACGQGRARGCW